MPNGPGGFTPDLPDDQAEKIIRRIENMSDRSAVVLLMEQAQDNGRTARATHALIEQLSDRFVGCENAVAKQTVRLDTYDRRFAAIERRQERMETAQSTDSGRLTRLEAWKDEKVGAVEGRRNWLKWLVQTLLGSSVLAGVWHYMESLSRHK